LIIPTQFTVTNNFHAVFKIVGIYLDIYYKTTDLARLNEDISDNPIIVPGNSTIVTAPQPVKLTSFSIIALVDSLIGDAYLDVHGRMHIQVDDFDQTVEYSQFHVAASFVDHRANIKLDSPITLKS